MFGSACWNTHLVDTHLTRLLSFVDSECAEHSLLKFPGCPRLAFLITGTAVWFFRSTLDACSPSASTLYWLMLQCIQEHRVWKVIVWHGLESFILVYTWGQFSMVNPREPNRHRETPRLESNREPRLVRRKNCEPCLLILTVDTEYENITKNEQKEIWKCT